MSLERFFAPIAPAARRFDGMKWHNPSTGQGTALDRHASTEIVPTSGLSCVEVDALIRYEGIGRRIVMREPYDATREGFCLAQGLEQVEEAASVLGVLPTLSRAGAWANAYGGALIVPMLDDGGQDPRDPLDMRGLRQVLGFRVLDRTEAVVVSYARDGARVGMPDLYSVRLQGARTSVIHHSRVVRVSGVDVPDRLKLYGDGWESSRLDLVWIHLRNWLATADRFPELVEILTQGIFKHSNLDEQLESEASAAEVAARYRAMRKLMGITGDIVLGNAESYEVLTRPVTGAAELVDKLIDLVVACSDMPRSILLGSTLGGLNTGENAGEVRSWYDAVRITQRNVYTPALSRMLRLISGSALGPTAGAIPSTFGITWHPLWQPTESERRAWALQDAQRRQIDQAFVTRSELRSDPTLAQHYVLEPEAPASPDAAVTADDLDEGEGIGLVEAPQSLIPADGLKLAKVIAERLGVRPSTLHAMSKRGDFPAFRIGGRWGYAWSHVEAAIAKGIRQGGSA